MLLSTLPKAILLTFAAVSSAAPREVDHILERRGNFKDCTVASAMAAADIPDLHDIALFYTGEAEYNVIERCAASGGEKKTIYQVWSFDTRQSADKVCGNDYDKTWGVLSQAMGRLASGEAWIIRGPKGEGKFWKMEKEELLANAKVTKLIEVDCDGKKLAKLKG